MSAVIYPWNATLFSSLLARHERQQLAHALLISGMPGLGKRQLAREFAASLLCQQANAQSGACQQCKSCQLLAADAHPDYLSIAAEKTGAAIVIDQIRQLTQFAALKSQLGGVQVVVIEDAQRMNRNAANALLKTLEEPNENLYLLLLSDAIQSLLPTIRSRCQHYRIGVPDHQAQLHWLTEARPGHTSESLQQALSLAYGAPELALAYLDEHLPAQHEQHLALFLALSQARISAIEVANAWNHGDFHHNLQWLYAWVVDLIRLKSGLHVADKYREALLTELERVAHDLDIDALFYYHQQIIAALRLQHTQVNQQLLIERLLILWHNLCAGSVVRSAITALGLT